MTLVTAQLEHALNGSHEHAVVERVLLDLLACRLGSTSLATMALWRSSMSSFSR